MQSVPILGSIGAVAVAYIWATGTERGSWQPALLFIAGMLPLQLLNAAMCLAAGTWTNFWMLRRKASCRVERWEALGQAKLRTERQR